MSTITEARALLQRVREGATPGQWPVNLIWSQGIIWDDASLIVLLAGNTALLDAIDGMLADAAHIEEHFTDDVESGFRHYAERIASALVQQGTAMGIVQDVSEVEQ